MRALFALALLLPGIALAQPGPPPGGGGGGGCVSNCTFTGTTTTSGITDSGGINTTSVIGFQLGGVNAMRSIGTVNSATLIGRLAGASLTSGSYQWTTFGGDSSGQNYTTAGEITCYGAGSCQQEIDGVHVTGIGVAALYYENHGSADTAVGNDSCRNCVGVSGVTAVGGYSHANVFSSNNTSLGNLSMYGNSASILFSGTPTANETITLTFTNAGNLPGSPVALTYPVGASPTLANIASGLVTAMLANSAITNANIRGSVVAVSPNVLAIQYNGSSAVGTTLTVTYGTTGTTVAAITGGTSALGDGAMIAIGFESIYGARMTTATRLIGVGEATLANVTTATDDVCIGYLACQNMTTDTQSNLIGSQAGLGLSGGGFSNNALGYFCLKGATTAKSNVVIGDCQFTANAITTAVSTIVIGSNAQVPSATASGQLVIGNGIYGTGFTANQTTVSPARVGFGIKAPIAAVTVGDDGGGADDGHLQFVQLTTPTTINAGGTLDAKASDAAGTITLGSASTGAIVTFGHGFTNQPHCVVSARSSASTYTSYTSSVSALTLVTPSQTSSVYDYHCF